jgi:hypothetical protein
MMVLNPDLLYLLDQQCDVLRPAEAQVGMRTMSNLASLSTGVAVHVQAMTPREMAYGYGYEQEGNYLAFFHSTQALAVGDMVRMTTGPHAAKRFWLRGEPTLTDVCGIQHTMASLEYTEDSTSG